MGSKTDKTRQYLEIEEEGALPLPLAEKNNELHRRPMERTPSTVIHAEKEDLKEAAEHSSTVILELNLDGKMRWVSQSWEDVIGTSRDSVLNKLISDILLYDRDAFKGAVEAMKGGDSRSSMLRFSVKKGPLSKLSKNVAESVEDGNFQMDEVDDQDQVLEVEAQGILIYDRSTGEPSHTMWVLRPFVERNALILELPPDLVESLGVGATMLAQYLTSLAEQRVADPENYPPPMQVLCRICERQIQPWWFEKHSDLCLLEHQAESEVQLAQDNLVLHRRSIVKILDALGRHHPRPSSGDPNSSLTYAVQYRGFPIGPPSSSSSSSSGNASPTTTPARSRDSPASAGRPRSFVQRRPQVRIVELLLDLCDTALEISTPAIKESHSAVELGAFRTQSPQSESRISQVQQWASPSTNTLEQEHGLALLCADTEAVAKAKVEAVLRHQRTIEYSERIRLEFSMRVQDCIDETLQRAAEAANEVTVGEFDECESEQENGEEPPLFTAAEFDSNTLSKAFIGSGSECSLGPTNRPRRLSSPGTVPSGTNSPQECPTPKSQHSQRIIDVSRRNSRYSQRSSMIFDSEGADGDASTISSLVTTIGHTDSPGSDQELTLARAGSVREKRRSAYHSGSPRRQASPARMIPSSSPLRISKPRIQNLFGDVPSPLLPTGDFSPALESFHHRRQSSAASSDVMAARPPLSPRLTSVNAAHQRAVQPSIKDFEIIKPISKGAFGSVYLSKKKSTGDYYAIKVLKKADMIAKNQVTNVRAERAIMMVQGESDFVAKLFWTFQSKDYLYLVMEYLNGGDCAALIKQLGGLPEEWAKKYLAEVILGVEHLHNRGIVHRDLKPDNLLIDQKGHLKLTDFGLSRMGLLGRQRRAQVQSAESTPDLLKQGPFARSKSVHSSRSASFDFPGGSPSQTPLITPEQYPQLVAPSYFNLSRESTLSRENSRRTSNPRSDTGGSDSLSTMLNNFSLSDPPPFSRTRRTQMEEDARSESSTSSDFSALGLQHMSPHSSQNQLPQSQTQTALPPPPLALFDPEDNNHKFVGTPDYLAPETINGSGQDEMSDWWSLGCILFEFLFGYPPFHADTPEKVFENILNRRIDWPPEELEDEDEPLCSPEAKDLMNCLMCTDPSQRLGANGADEVRKHPWFKGLNWETLLQEEPSFIPTPQDPEDTDYFDSRGATLQSFVEEFEDQSHSPNILTPGADIPERPHDAVSGLRREMNHPKRGVIPLHIPPHVREGRSRRLSEPVQDDFGSFAFKNLPVLEKANKDVIQRLRSEALKAPPVTSSPSSPVDISTAVPVKPLARALSNSSKHAIKRPVSPSGLNQGNTSTAAKTSQPSSPLMVSFTVAQPDKQKSSSATSSITQAVSEAASAPIVASAPTIIPIADPTQLGPSAAIDVPRLATNFHTSLSSASTSPVKTKSTSITSHSSASTSPVRTHAKQLPATCPPKAQASQPHASGPAPRARSLTVSSQESDQAAASALENWKKQQKRRSQVFDMSPSSSDNEESRTSALLRVQKRRHSSRRMSSISLMDGPVFRPLDVLVCEEHPVSRMVMERMLEKLRCRTIAVENGSEAMRCAMGEVKFDIIFMEFKLPQISGEDVARMIRTSQNANSSTPIVAVTGYIKELLQPHYFESLVEKPMTTERLIEVLGTFCMWKPPPPERFQSERRDSFSLKKPEEDRAGRISPSVEKLMFKKGSSLGQVSYTNDEAEAQRRNSPSTIPRSTKAEWDNLNVERAIPMASTIRKPSPKHLGPPVPFSHSPPEVASNKNLERVPSKLSMETPLDQAPLPSVPAMPPLPPPVTNIPTLNLSSPERKSKRSSLEKRCPSSVDVEDADDELSKKKPSKSRSIGDFAAKIKRVSAEMKRSKSNISE